MKIASGLGLAAVVAVMVVGVRQSVAWGADGHRTINRLAAEMLPKEVPDFLRSSSAVEAMEYYGPEPDHWKSQAEPELSAVGSADHFMDMEWADLVGSPLPRKRYDYVRALGYAQAKHPDMTLTPEKVGLLPYRVEEDYERLKSAMRDYRTLVALHKEVRPLECEIVFLAGVLGHFVADGSQPLHTSIYYNGWTGANPNGYTTLHTIHANFESTFVKANVKGDKDVAPLVTAKAAVLGDVFEQYVGYLRKSNGLVEKTYQLEKAGAFNGQGTPEGKAFVDERLAAGVTELRDLIYTAWVRSADPVPAYRNSQKVSDN